MRVSPLAVAPWLLADLLAGCGSPYHTPPLAAGGGAEVTLRTTNASSASLMLFSMLRVSVVDYGDRCPDNRIVGTPALDDAYLGEVELTSSVPASTIVVPSGRRTFFLFRQSEATFGVSRLCDAEAGFVAEAGRRYVLEHHATVARCDVVVALDSPDVPSALFDRVTCGTDRSSP
ncbi:MAG: hypothetical protein ACREQL_12705 [Candidatus Binatia bacterium]